MSGSGALSLASSRDPARPPIHLPSPPVPAISLSTPDAPVWTARDGLMDTLENDDFPPLSGPSARTKNATDDDRAVTHEGEPSNGLARASPSNAGEAAVPEPPAREETISLTQRLTSILAISAPDGARPPSPTASTSSKPSSPSRKPTKQTYPPSRAPSIPSSTPPEAATLKDWMSRILSPASAAAARKASVHVPKPAMLPSTRRRSGSLRSVSAPETSRSRSSERRSSERGEPVLLSSSPSASSDLEEALNEEIFPTPSLPPSTSSSGMHVSARGTMNVALPERAHLYPVQSPLSPPPHGFPHGHGHGHHPPQLLTSLTRSTLPTASLSLQPLPPVHLSSAPSNIRRSTSLFSRAGMGLLPAREDSTEGSVGSVDQLRMLYSGPAQKDDESGGNGWAFADWWRAGKERDRTAPLLEPGDRGTDQEDAAERIQRKYKTPHNPMIFCHGLLGFDAITFPLPPPLGSFSLPPIYHWRGITDVLRTNGVEVYVMRVPATSGISERAKVLREKITEKCRGRKVHLVGHSMGGLDCRYLASRLECEFEVLTVTTVSTPHRGSSFADYCVHDLIGRDRLPAVISLVDTILPYSDGDGTAFEQLTTTHMREFNALVPDKPGVRYFSWGATYEPGLVDSFRWPHGVILAKEGPNDGLVSVESAKWGNYEGTVTHVNHLDLIGWMNAARYRWAEFVGTKIEYRPATFYLGVASRIAEVEEEMERREREDGGVD